MKNKYHFVNRKIRVLIGAIALIALAWAGWDVAVKRRGQTPVLKVELQALDPCWLATARHSGASALDKDIARYQILSQGTHSPNAYLERLGWAYIGKARSSFDPGYFKLAQQTALCLQHRDPGNNQAQLLLGHVLHNLHLFKESEQLARSLVQQRGLWLDYALLGDVLMEQGKLLNAIDAYQSMIDQRPGPQGYFRAAHMRWLKGDLSGALELMYSVVGALSNKDKETAAWAWVRLSTYQRQAGHPELAEAYIERALTLQPGYAPALLLRGEILMSRGQYSQALDVLWQAVEINPLPLYQWAYREALLQVGDEDGAAQVNQQLMQQGAILDRRSFALYLASNKQNAPLALDLTRQELVLRQDVFTMDAMAWALHANGQHEQAWQFVKLALAEGTNDARLFYHAGVIAEALGLRDIAHDYCTRATEQQYMLLPSERQDLESRFVAIVPQSADLTLSLMRSNHNSTTTGEI